MPKLGLKMWSTNTFYIEPARELYQKNVFDYVELYVVCGSDRKYLDQWKKSELPFLLHAPHSYGGLNFSLCENESKNRTLINEVDCFRRELNPKMVIFHPGILGSLKETICQIKIFKNEFQDLFDMAVVENKPRIGLKGETCVGSSPEEVKGILDETGLGFCLDIGHAICYAAWKQTDHEKIIDQFMALSPALFHISDGDVNSQTDAHLNFGMGNFDLNKIIRTIPLNSYVSIETKKNSKNNLDDFKKDVTFFREYFSQVGV